MDSKVKYIPIAQLYLSMLSAFVPFDFFPAGDLLGYSILTNIVYWHLFNKSYVRDFVIALFVLNIVSCFKGLFNYNEWALYYDLSIFVMAHLRLLKYVK